MSDHRRRTYGFIIGLTFGLPFALISQFINEWMLPGIPLFDLPVGRVATVILTTLFMVILGLIIAWDEESFWGVLGGSFGPSGCKRGRRYSPWEPEPGSSCW